MFRNHRTRGNSLWPRWCAVLTLVLAVLPGLIPAASAQAYGVMIIGALTCDNDSSCWNEIGAQFTVTTEDGTFVGSCTAEGERNASNVEGCNVAFPFEISGTLIVTENIDTITPGYLPEENPIYWSLPDPVTRPSHDVVFRNLPAGTGVDVAETSDIAIVPTENGVSITDACFELTTFGNNGCDDNGDGKITFRDVPLGTYTVHQTADLGPSRSIEDFTITVTGALDTDGWEAFTTSVSPTGSNSSEASGTAQTAQDAANGGLWNLGITAHMRDSTSSSPILGAQFRVTSETGEYIGECTLTPIDRDVPWLNCRVDVPSDRISLVWLNLNSIPAGYAPVENPISFDPTTYITGPHNIGASFQLVPADSNADIGVAHSPQTRDIALITRDPDDGHLLYDGCYVLLEYGNDACDENGDGQITYADIPFGIYTVHQTSTPSGYPTVEDFTIDVSDQYPAVPLGYVVRQAVDQNAPGTRNVSVVFVDSRTHTKIESSMCVELLGGSEMACDDALVDGQIDFLDVPMGTYPIEFSGLQTGWQIQTGDLDGADVTIEAGIGPQFLFFEIYVPDAGGTGAGSGNVNSPDTGNAANATSGSSAETWTAAVWVRICDTTPDSDVDGHCRGAAGVVVNFSLASGEFLGSCTTGEPYLTPWSSNTVSDCTLDGMPFNADIVATQDLSTLPPGYEPNRETSVIHIGPTLQPWGDGPPFSFVNHLTDTGPTANTSASATLLMTFRGCPEGFDPATDDFFANCTIPLDAPDASIIVWGGDGQGGMPIMQLERQYNGAYIYNAGPNTMNVDLGRLAPVVRDGYTVVGHDIANGDIYSVELVAGETRDVFVFYYFL